MKSYGLWAFRSGILLFTLAGIAVAGNKSMRWSAPI
jgi:hypothetical protein